MQRMVFAASWVLALTATVDARAESRVLDVTVRAGAHARVQTPAKSIVNLPAKLVHEGRVKMVDGAGHEVPAQLTFLGLPNVEERTSPDRSAEMPAELHFVVPELPAEGVWQLTATFGETVEAPAAQFAWHDEQGVTSELRFGDRPVLRYMYAPLDESTPERRAETYKVYHHVFSPDGKTLLTKGPGGLFPHHRGLFYGFNRISYGDQKADTWHCTNGAYQAHRGAFLSQEAGPVLGRHRFWVDWHGQDSAIFANEIREMTVFALPSGTWIEFASQLRTQGPPIKLDGDPQHAGFQFRAAQEVAESTNKQTYYLRPNGKGAPGETLNWPEAAEMVNLPWHAMSCVIGGERYTIVMFDRPQNPKEARFSERDYGRFGSYFEYDLTVDRPLDLHYRVWVQAGEMTAEQIAAKQRDFVEPVVVEVAPR